MKKTYEFKIVEKSQMTAAKWIGITIGILIAGLLTVVVTYFSTEGRVYYQKDSVICYEKTDIGDSFYTRQTNTSRFSDTIKWFENKSKSASCAGIGLFYTSRGFGKDWEVLKTEYDRVYNTNGLETGVFKKPEDIYGNSSNIDCEDFAHFSDCLADLYEGVECSFFWDETAGRMDGYNTAHLGVCCNDSSVITCY